MRVSKRDAVQRIGHGEHVAANVALRALRCSSWIFGRAPPESSPASRVRDRNHSASQRVDDDARGREVVRSWCGTGQRCAIGRAADWREIVRVEYAAHGVGVN